jgi:hypothetical protein
MGILNYTTTITANKTVGEIQGILAKHGASSISVDYEKGHPINLVFLLDIGGVAVNFRLPSNWQGVYQALKQDKSVAAKYKTPEQALRVSWRISKDWVEAQLAIVEAKKADMGEVFLPYAVFPNGKTMYEVFKEQGLNLLKSRV